MYYVILTKPSTLIDNLCYVDKFILMRFQYFAFKVNTNLSKAKSTKSGVSVHSQITEIEVLKTLKTSHVISYTHAERDHVARHTNKILRFHCGILSIVQFSPVINVERIFIDCYMVITKFKQDYWQSRCYTCLSSHTICNHPLNFLLRTRLMSLLHCIIAVFLGPKYEEITLTYWHHTYETLPQNHHFFDKLQQCNGELTVNVTLKCTLYNFNKWVDK